MQRSKTLIGVIAGAAALLITAGVTTVGAAPANVPSGVPTTTTLPLFGVALTVDVTTGPGGVLSTVTVNPSDGLTATTLKPNRVVFENTDGTGKVSVGSGHGRQSVSTRAGLLGDISGDGGWSGDVFNTGVATTVAFAIGSTTEGGPDITGVSSSDATAVISATEYKSETDGDHEGDSESYQSARAKVTFSAPGETRTLSITATVKTDEDGTTSASARVTLGRLHATALSIADAVGSKSWSGLLCDGSVATINYSVAEDGVVTFTDSAPTATDVRADEGRGIEVRFSMAERIRIRGSLSADGITVRVSENIRCNGAADPSVNTPVSTIEDDDDEDDDAGHDGHHDGGKGGDTPPTTVGGARHHRG